ncbi:Hint domain-containing protein [Oceaniglobus trochenteri]|uniref:Hint domain-containing protein n=1 Tax=Oceaniglobus trochenteri TaxID=2763260 RepID=UPI001CFFFEBD|nr:Hint domain-containing protein [Oceaniglobus trochenteri]
MATFNDQFFTFDPANPPTGSSVTFSRLDLTDANNDGDVDRFNSDSVNGSDVVRSYPGDTVTIATGSGNVTYTGITFYTADGGRYFTPTDGQVLQNGTVVGATAVSGQGPLQMSNLGPSCFVAGTRLRTPNGMRPVEGIAVGEQVKTRDSGIQTVRWVGQSTTRGIGPAAPVRFAPGAIGNTRELRVSQQHRMLVRGPLAEIYFGAGEVLTAARHLVNGRDITFAPCAEVTYLHLLFDRHEILFAENAPCESFHPGDTVLGEDDAMMDELRMLFPDFDGLCAEGAWRMARPVVRGSEAAVLVNQGAA